MPEPVIIVGAGLAGLNCAKTLHGQGLEVLLLERDAAVGGRVQTDEVNGFLLDRGFQVLLTDYPAAREALDYEALRLGRFVPGALVRVEGSFHLLSDPFRDTRGAVGGLVSPVGTVWDKLRVLRFRNDVAAQSVEAILERPETTTLDALNERGFSPNMIERFFRPFFGGIMLDRSLRGSSRMVEFVFKMFSQGWAALPADGMRTIPTQLADQLPPHSIRLGKTVMDVRPGSVVTNDGEELRARAVVVATDETSSSSLLGTTVHRQVSTRTLYYAAEKPPVGDAVLILNGDGIGPINNAAVVTNVAPTYSSTKDALISVTVLDDWPHVENLQETVRGQLVEWFGDMAASWKHIRTYYVRNALPDQRPPFLTPPHKDVRMEPGLYRAGDYLDTASINGAMAAGKRAAHAVLEDLASA